MMTRKEIETVAELIGIKSVVKDLLEHDQAQREVIDQQAKEIVQLRKRKGPQWDGMKVSYPYV